MTGRVKLTEAQPRTIPNPRWKVEPIAGFAALNGCVDKPYIMVWSIRGRAKHVREAVAEAWGSWAKAKKDGIRVIKITVANRE